MTNMFKANPVKERNEKICDIVWMLVIGCFIMMAAVICLAFAKRLVEEDRPGPASVLIFLGVCALVFNCIYMVVAIRRMRKRKIIGKRMRLWHVGHDIVRRKQKQECIINASNRISHCSPVQMSTKHKNLPVVENKRNNLMLIYMLTSSCTNYSMGPYKEAMFNPVTPDKPILQDVNSSHITIIDETSPTVLGKCVSYLYQPPECGTTSFLINESRTLLRETGV